MKQTISKNTTDVYRASNLVTIEEIRNENENSNRIVVAFDCNGFGKPRKYVLYGNPTHKNINQIRRMYEVDENVKYAAIRVVLYDTYINRVRSGRIK